jgi:predicted amidohydrolase
LPTGRSGLSVLTAVNSALGTELALELIESSAYSENMSRIAIVQLCSTPDRAANHAAVAAYVESAARQGAALVALPENWAYIGPEDAKEGAAEALDGPSLSLLSELSRKHKVWILGGTILRRSDDAKDARPTNHCSVWDDQGICRASYDKIHLFDAGIPGGAVFQESTNIRAGDQPVVVETPVGCIGLSVCYDLRFGWLYRAMARAGATLFAVPSAFTRRTGPLHWEPLLRARAIEHLAYVVAPAQVGVHCEGRRSYGHSMLVEPFGAVTARIVDSPGLSLAEVDPERVARLRQQLPVAEHDRGAECKAVLQR